MATSTAGTFDVWLTEKLTSVSPDIDTDVFVSYIIGMLDENVDQDEETEEGIVELLSGVVTPELASEATKAILHHWDATKDDRAAVAVQDDIGDKLSEILGKQTLATVGQEKKLTKEEAARKAAILAQYAQVSDGEETDEEDDSMAAAEEQPQHQQHQAVQPAGGGGGGVKHKVETVDPLLIRNANKEDVNRAEREKRERAKEEGEKKKEKDKQDRLAQKQKQQERKDQEKKRTQKGEKRR